MYNIPLHDQCARLYAQCVFLISAFAASGSLAAGGTLPPTEIREGAGERIA